MNYNNIDYVELDGIDTNDYPDFCDAYIISATWKNGESLTDNEIELLNDNRDFVYEKVISYLF